MFQQDRPRKKYPSDLTDEPWAIVAPLLPPAKQHKRGGHPSTVDIREVRNTIFSLPRRGCQWDRLPHDVLPKSTASDSVAQGRDDGTWAKVVKVLRAPTRVAAGREPTPSAGRDAGGAAPLLRGHVTPDALPRLVTILAEQQYHNHALDAWLAEHRTGWRMEAKVRPEGMKGFTPREKRWVIERTNAWNGRYRRNSKDDERSVESSTAMIQISNINLMLHRLAPYDRPAFHYRKNAA